MIITSRGAPVKAVSLTAIEQLEIIDLPCPEPAAGEVLVEVALTGICGSDVPRYFNGWVKSYPVIPGHEFSGTIKAVGAGVDAALAGKRVTAAPLVPCMTCEPCKRGDYALCRSFTFIGTSLQGSMAQYVAVPESNIVEISDEVSMLQAAFFEPATVALHGASLIGFSGLDPQPQARVGVIGAGTIGLLLAQALKAYQVSSVTIFDVSGKRLSSARVLGLTDVIDTSTSEGQEHAQQMEGLTHVFDAAGSSETIALALELAGPHAQVCFIGTPKSSVELSALQWENLNRKELTVRGSWMSYSAPWPGAEWREAEELFANQTMRIADDMIDTIYPLEQAKEAFERFRDPATVRGKILLDSRMD